MSKPVIIALLVSFALLHGMAAHILASAPPGADPDSAAISFTGD
ncbi:MAG: hypothetical protein U1E61_17630 [Bradyrhizobium sp.]